MSRFNIAEKITKSIINGGQKVLKKRGACVSNPLFAEAKNLEVVGMDVMSLASKPRAYSIAEFEKYASEIGCSQWTMLHIDGLKEVARLKDGSLDTGVLDLAHKICGITEKNGMFLMSPELFINYTKGCAGEALNPELHAKMLEIFTKVESQKSLSYLEFMFKTFGTQDVGTKKMVLDLIPELMSYAKRKEFSTGTLGEVTAKFINSVIERPDVNKVECLTKLKNLYKNANGKELELFAESAGSYANFPEPFFKLIDSRIIPNQSLMEVYKSSPEKFEEALSLLKELNFESAGVNAEFINEVLLNNKSLIKKSLSEYKSRFKHMKFLPDACDNNKYVLKFTNDFESGVMLQFDKKTQKLIYKQNISLTPSEFNRISTIESTGTRIEQSYNLVEGYPALRNEIRTSANAKVYLQESPVEGMFDIYRVGKNGKIDVLSKSFKDPTTGETVIKRNLKSFGGTKSFSRYAAEMDGSCNFTYTIRDRAGNELLNVDRKMHKLADNHFLHFINGERYDVIIENDIIKVIDANGKNVLLDLKTLANGANSELIETLKQLPADDLIKIRELGVPCFVTGKTSQVNYMGMAVQNVEIAVDDSRSISTILHELGHIKESYFEREVYEKINKVYQKELSAYRKNTCCVDNVTMDYIIENADHYLSQNGRYGALEEVIADVNAMIKHPNDNKDLAERTIKFMEAFPETIAEIARYL